jgi:hypothetical protein
MLTLLGGADVAPTKWTGSTRYAYLLRIRLGTRRRELGAMDTLTVNGV